MTKLMMTIVVRTQLAVRLNAIRRSTRRQRFHTLRRLSQITRRLAKHFTTTSSRRNTITINNSVRDINRTTGQQHIGRSSSRFFTTLLRRLSGTLTFRRSNKINRIFYRQRSVTIKSINLMSSVIRLNLTYRVVRATRRVTKNKRTMFPTSLQLTRVTISRWHKHTRLHSRPPRLRNRGTLTLIKNTTNSRSNLSIAATRTRISARLISNLTRLGKRLQRLTSHSLFRLLLPLIVYLPGKETFSYHHPYRH